MCSLPDLGGRVKENFKTVCKALKSKFSWTSNFADGNYSIPIIFYSPSLITYKRLYLKVFNSKPPNLSQLP